MVALSIMTMLRGFVPLKGISCGKRFFSTKSQKTSESTVPVVQYASTSPFTVIIPITDTRLPLTNNRRVLARHPKQQDLD